LSGSTVLGLEDTGALMNRIGKSELCWGAQMSVDDMLANIAAVTPDDVRAVAREVLGQRPSLSVIGPLKDKQADRLHTSVS
ncbi:insulinase family protein, partial [[Kitasatospora] papulosa]